jgi:ER lumen protein retaining receptor
LCRYFTEGVVDPIAVVAGIVQTGLYIDFFYVYFTKCVFIIHPCRIYYSHSLLRVLQGQKFELPA